MQKIVITLVFAFSGWCTPAQAQELHGPICSWHLDPTSTMNVQWIEKVNAAIDDGRWFVGTAGFGYGDDDDATQLAMQNKHRTLYIRQEFKLRALPTEQSITVFGGWTAVAQRKSGESITHGLTVSFDFQSRSTTGQVKQGDAESDLSKVDIAGQSVEVEYKMLLDGTERNIRVTAEASGEANDKLAGTWEAVDDQGTSIETGKWTADLTDPPRFGGGRRGGNRSGRGNFGNRGGDPKVKLVLRVRYDDGFIA
ncbi:MAG: hypothetical protein KDB27_35310, partial [Planctomycetales bacterium]|nr:hypothetical protein [Planctomycetales bacterium]